MLTRLFDLGVYTRLVHGGSTRACVAMMMMMQVSVVAKGGVELLVSALQQHPADLPALQALCRATWKISRGDEQKVKV